MYISNYPLYTLQNTAPTYLVVWNHPLGYPPNTRTIQEIQVIYLHVVAKASWYATDIALHNDLQISTTGQTSTPYYLRPHSKMEHHSNTHISQLHSSALPENPIGYLKCEWLRDHLNANHIKHVFLLFLPETTTPDYQGFLMWKPYSLLFIRRII